ncbi:MAG: phage terminase large subunit [Halobacteriota archaeon]
MTYSPAWCAISHTRGKWQPADHLIYLDEKLRDIAAGRIKRLMVFMPPRHGKSELISKHFPAWYLGTFPNNHVILVSYEADFASSWGRKAREVLDELGDDFGVKVKQESSAAKHWEIEGHSGGMDAAGAYGPITGKGADVLVIDDPVKNAEEAYSPLQREKLWDWYQSTAFTRLEPNGAIILVMTRWHEDDLAGRLLKQEQGQWETVSLPALAEAEDALHRTEGEALWPERFPVEQLLEKKQAVGSYWWSAMYQQRPVPMEGGFFKRDWLQFYDPEYVPYMDIVVQSWDTAQSKSSTSDFVVGQVWGRRGPDFYLLDQVRGRLDFDETVTAIKDLSKQWKQCSAKLIESQTLGAALSSHLKHQIDGIIPIDVRASKELRALNCVPVWQSKNVYLPKPDDGEYVWVQDYVRELLNFPNASNDDQVDATTLALNQLRGTLFPDVAAAAVENISSQPLPEHNYFIGWIPARRQDTYTALVLDLGDNTVVSFGKYDAEPIENQITSMYQLSRMYNGAVVRAIDDLDEAMLFALEVKGVYVQRVAMNRKKWAAAVENLAMLMRNDNVIFPHEPNLLAELEVFKSEFTLDESPDYSIQTGAQSAIHALCLVTYDLIPEVVRDRFRPSIYYSYDRSLFP